jgi:hypothetical protein
MVQHELSMRSETAALEDECQRLQLLVGELLQKNHQLRSEVARLHDALAVKTSEGKNLPIPPPRFTVSKTIFDWESIG